LFHRLIKQERGYSLVEVMVSIFILAIAIIPMVGMFDTGLKSATAGSNYDRARALADSNLEKVRSLPYATAKVAYKPVNATPTAGTPVSCDQGMFDCEVTTTYVDGDLNDSSTGINRMRVEVVIEWDSSKSYTTTGLKTK
jgi:prepilin-type N-terminal cleavage/methylation domain-containing protein